jgi:hypothetical protein
LRFTLVALSVVVFGPSTATLAGQVTNVDLAGKKICWSNGAFTTFHKDGTFDCTMRGHGTWRLDGDTLTENNSNGVFVWKIAKNGRTLRESSQNGPLELQGSYCK